MLIFTTDRCNLISALADSAVSYVQSMESQQTRLIKALQKVHRDVQQAIKEEDMKEIVQIVRQCGFDFESMPETSASHIESGDLHTRHGTIGIEGRVATAPRKRRPGKESTGDRQQRIDGIPMSDRSPDKRKRGEINDPITTALPEHSDTDQGIVPETSSTVPNDSSDDGLEFQASPSKRRKSSTFVGLVGNHRGLDNGDDQAACLNILSDLETLLEAPLADQSMRLDAEHTSHAAENPYQAILPSTQYTSHTTAEYEPYPIICGVDDFPPSVVSHAEGSDSFLNAPRQPDSAAAAIDPATSTFVADFDWESTLWWDPSLVFDMDVGNPGLGVDSVSSFAI